jgi:GAF domain-containing protein
VLSMEHPAPNAFTKEDERAVELLASQAAIAIQNAQQHEITKRAKESLEALHEAAEAMAGSPDFTEVLQIIVGKAMEMFGADSSALWPYDDTQGRFIRDEPVTAGISARQLEKLIEEEPKPGRTSYTVLEKGWIGLGNILSREADFLGQTTRGLLKRIKVMSFQGVALKVANEPVGVLYVNYKRPRSFDESDRRRMENFARYAALSLMKARLSHEVKTAALMSRVAASMTALGESEATLLAVKSGMQSAVGCDAVVLYTYDPIKCKLDYPPTHVGVHDPEDAWPAGELHANALEYVLLQRDELHIAEQISKDDLFKGKRFALREHIESCVAIPLIAAGQKVGVMFVNYRTRHRFSKDELISIQLFANQAAVAISNAQLYEQAQRRGDALAGLSQAGRAITGSLSLVDTLHQISQQALRVIKGACEGCFSHVALREGDALNYISASSEEMLETLRRRAARVSLRPARARGKNRRRFGIAGRAVVSGKVQNIGDVRNNSDYVPLWPEIKSQLSVPLKIAKEIIGVLSIEHPNFDAFSVEDVQNVELLAAQAAVAIHNAKQFEELQKALEELKKTRGQVGSAMALAWMGMATNTWRHSIEGNAINVRNTVAEFLLPEIRRSKLSPAKRRRVEEWLELVETEAETILERPITPPLSDEEGIESVPVNDFIKGWIKEFWKNRESAKGVKPVFRKAMDDAVSINCSPDWLGRAFDHLANNALKAMAKSPTRRLTITSRLTDNSVKLAFIDTGKGIPGSIRVKLFNARIKTPKGKGLGMGLLIAKAIVETYQGDIWIEATGPSGTTVALRFPVGEGEE